MQNFFSSHPQTLVTSCLTTLPRVSLLSCYTSMHLPPITRSRRCLPLALKTSSVSSSPLTMPPCSPEPVITPNPIPPALIQVPCPAQPNSNSDFSDSDVCTHLHNLAMDNSQYMLATVLGGKGSHAPILSAGRITIPVVCIFENACQRFFQNKKLPKNKQVLSIIYNFESSAVQSWIMMHHDHLVELTFIEFFTEFKNKFLPVNWKDDLVTTQITMQGSQSFLAWTEGVCEMNAKLAIAGSYYHIAEEKLYAHFVPRLSPALKTSYDANNT